MCANPKGRWVIRPSSSELNGIFNAYFRQFHQDWGKKVTDGQKKYDAMQAIPADLRKGV